MEERSRSAVIAYSMDNLGLGLVKTCSTAGGMLEAARVSRAEVTALMSFVVMRKTPRLRIECRTDSRVVECDSSRSCE